MDEDLRNEILCWVFGIMGYGLIILGILCTK